MIVVAEEDDRPSTCRLCPTCVRRQFRVQNRPRTQHKKLAEKQTGGSAHEGAWVAQQSAKKERFTDDEATMRITDYSTKGRRVPRTVRPEQHAWMRPEAGYFTRFIPQALPLVAVA